MIELGKRNPLGVIGQTVDVQQIEQSPGDVLECYYDSNIDFTTQMAARAIFQVQKIKETYPQVVIHYVKVESRRLTVQFSVAPMGANSGLSSAIGASVEGVAIAHLWVGVCLVILSLILLVITVDAAMTGVLFQAPKPTGNAVITAMDANTKLGLHGVRIYMDGILEGTTDGGSLTIKNILQGNHKFSGAIVSGYQAPDIEPATINKDQVTTVTIWYYPEDSPKPTTGILQIYTDPPGGEVYVDTEDKGAAPLSITVTIGDHTVGFGPLEGYITPIVQTVGVHGPEPVVVTGKYTLPGAPWWQGLIKWSAIGLTLTAAMAILIPIIAKAVRKGRE
jgi:hypothetical protein